MTEWHTRNGRVALGGRYGPTTPIAARSAAQALEAAFALHANGKRAQALAVCAQVLERYPDHVSAWHLQGQLRRDAGDLEGALKSYSHALTLTTRDHKLYNDCALVLSALGRFEQALAHFARALELAPGSIAAIVNRANLYARLQRTAEAESGYRQALHLAPGNPQALINLAALYERAARYSAAAKLTRKALEGAREDPALNLIAARLERRGKRFPKARWRLEQMLARKPADALEAAIERELGHLCDAQGDYASALRHYRHANRIAARLMRRRSATGSLNEALRALEAWVEGGIRLGAGSGRPTAAGPGPCFIVGFPGSGTHTVSTALLAAGITELAHERGLWGELNAHSAASQQDPQVLAALRERAIAATSNARGGVFIEVLALGLLYAPLALRLFPDARFVYVRRDVNDTLLHGATNTYLAPEIGEPLLKPAQARALLNRIDACWAVISRALGPRALMLDFDAVSGDDPVASEAAWDSLTGFLERETGPRPAASVWSGGDENRYPSGHARHYRDWLS